MCCLLRYSHSKQTNKQQAFKGILIDSSSLWMFCQLVRDEGRQNANKTEISCDCLHYLSDGKLKIYLNVSLVVADGVVYLQVDVECG